MFWEKKWIKTTYPNVRVDKHLHGALHVLLELGMKSVERAVHGNSRVLLVDVVEQDGEAFNFGLIFTQKSHMNSEMESEGWLTGSG